MIQQFSIGPNGIACNSIGWHSILPTAGVFIYPSLSADRHMIPIPGERSGTLAPHMGQFVSLQSSIVFYNSAQEPIYQQRIPQVEIVYKPIQDSTFQYTILQFSIGNHWLAADRTCWRVIHSGIGPPWSILEYIIQHEILRINIQTCRLANDSMGWHSVEAIMSFCTPF